MVASRGAPHPLPHRRGVPVPPRAGLHGLGQPPGKIADATNWNTSWGWAAGAMISRLGDLRKWARVVATGKLLTPATERERTRFLPAPGEGGATYGLGIMNYNGWISHDGNLPGYTTFPFHLAKPKTTMVVMFNSNYDILDKVLMMRAITKVISPEDVWPDPTASTEA